jgi:glycerol-3-phosphate acyltransferase PlsY
MEANIYSLGNNLLFILAAYLLGSVPQLQFLAKIHRIKLSGDYHTLLWQNTSKFVALLGIAGEFIKGALPVLVGRWLGLDLPVVAIAGLAAVCGQMWPVFSRFDGEKGNTVGLSMAAALDYRCFLVALIPIAIGLGIRMGSRLYERKKTNRPLIGGPYSRSLPLGMIAGFLVLPVMSRYFDRPFEITLAFSALVILILIRRLTAGLRRDLKVSRNLKKIFLGRLLYDRAVSQYRVYEL